VRVRARRRPVPSFGVSRRAPLLALAAALLGTVLAVVGPASPAGAYPFASVGLAGHGWGHGNGLGQWGSLGYAVDHDWSAAQILDHYYGGTTAGTQADAEIGVRLTAFDGRDMVVTSGSPFTIGFFAFAPTEAARVIRTGATWRIEKAPGCAGPWTLVAENIDGAVEPEAFTNYGGDDVELMLRACQPDGNVRSYRGRIKVLSDAGTNRTVNLLPMEQYLRGVVPRESPASWGDLDGGRGIEALKAQSVAARSYAWAEARYPYARTCDTISCQVYGGAGLNGARIEHANTDRAIAETSGVVRRTGSGGPARTEFSSSTGGHTSGRTFPAVVDEGDDVAGNPNHDWTASVGVTAIEAAYPIGELQSISVTRRNGLGQDGGRVTQVTIRGSAGTVTRTGSEFRSTFGLKSDWFSFTDPVLKSPGVGMAASRAASGYWLTSTTGEIAAFGDAPNRGSAAGLPLTKPVVGMAPTPTGQGYWLVSTDGGIFSYGDAQFFGSMGGRPLNQPIVGMAATPTGKGYWMVASDGGIFSFGDARFFGSMGGRRLNQPVVGMAADPNGAGYWLVARDGGIFSFGSARFHGSTGNRVLNQPIVGMAASPAGGYWFVAGDGGIFSFGAPFHGSAGGDRLRSPVVGMATTRTGGGYWLLTRDGTTLSYGDAVGV
jgi:SpoIID/LytB domain protein